MEAEFMHGFWKQYNKILKSTDRKCKSALSLSRISLNVLKFMNKNHYLWEFEKVC